MLSSSSIFRSKSTSSEALSDRVAGALAKFLLAGLFGCGVAWIILVELDQLVYSEPRLARWWIAAIWTTPLIWGVLGVVWFDKLLECGRRILEAYFWGDRK